jgi:hypothetical protein
MARFYCVGYDTCVMTERQKTIDELVKLLRGGSAHASLDEALEGLAMKDIGHKVHNLPYTIWQLTEHIRISQWDMLEFSRDANHVSPKWPDEYWPHAISPLDEVAWKRSLAQISTDLEAFITLLQGEHHLSEPFAWGEGQTMLREALQIADHNAYHAAEIIVIRRLLGAWK